MITENQTSEQQVNSQPTKQGDHQHNRQQKQTEDVIEIKTNIDLLNYLFLSENGKNEGTKLSKGQAYYQLLRSQVMAYCMRDISFLCQSYKQLANKWMWNRQTVASFIDKLVDLGEVSVHSLRGKNYILLNVNEKMTEVIENLLSETYGCLDGFSDPKAQKPLDRHQNPGGL